MRSVLRTTAWIAALALSLAGLLAAGDRLAPPPLDDLTAVGSWFHRTDPATATFSLVRLAAIVIVGYLLAATLVLVAAQASRVRVLGAAASRLTLPSARRLIRHAVGTGLAISVATSTAPVVAGAQAPPAPVTTLLDDPGAPVLHHVDDLVLVHLGPIPTPTPASTSPSTPTSTSTSRPAAAPAPAPADRASPGTPPPPDPAPATTGATRPPPGPLTRTEGAPAPAPAPPTTSAPAPRAEPGTSGPPPAPAPDEPTDEPVPATAPAPGTAPAPSGDVARAGSGPTHEIITGDHLWGVAEQTLRAAWAAEPEPAAIATYLHRLIEQNRSVLAVPGDPDLVFPGQVFELPEVPAR